MILMKSSILWRKICFPSVSTSSDFLTFQFHQHELLILYNFFKELLQAQIQKQETPASELFKILTQCIKVSETFK